MIAYRLAYDGPLQQHGPSAAVDCRLIINNNGTFFDAFLNVANSSPGSETNKKTVEFRAFQELDVYAELRQQSHQMC